VGLAAVTLSPEIYQKGWHGRSIRKQDSCLVALEAVPFCSQFKIKVTRNGQECPPHTIKIPAFEQ